MTLPPAESYREIPLTQGQVAKVSSHRYEELSQRSWHAYKHHTGKFYAKTNIVCSDGKWRVVHMSRMIMGVLYMPSVTIDHINGDSLDNRDENLRTTTQAENAKNRRHQRGATNRFKGVSLRHGKWRARITLNWKTQDLGTFPSAEDAARAYDAKARELFGEFAHLNFS